MMYVLTITADCIASYLQPDISRRVATSISHVDNSLLCPVPMRRAVLTGHGTV